MKRQILIISAVLALVLTGAVFAQTANTTAPGPTIQKEPGLTNNNLPNPGNPQTEVQPNTTAPAPSTDVQMHPETESTTGPVDVDVDTGKKAEGAVDVDVSTTPDADTDASGSGTETTTGTYKSDSSEALPSTASDLPSVALIGLLALGAFFALRTYSKRNA